ncbi:MAG: SPOR domain-containing protein [Rubrivivax sp.]|nr:SPOR domain-containing protein [Rubrivivax sp.]
MSRVAAGKGGAAQPSAQRKPQRGGFVLGLVAGLLIGLALALGVALYITKAPVPFIDKVPQRTAEQDSAEAERNRSWDPNALLGGKPARPAAPAGEPGASAAAPGSPAVATPPMAGPASAAATRPGRDPAAILSGVPTPPAPAASALAFDFYLQAGAYTRTEDAEGQRAQLAMLGQQAKISERAQAGRTVYRVRLGPFPSREEADALQGKLQGQGVESQIVRVERP